MDCGRHFRCAEFLSYAMVNLPQEMSAVEVTWNVHGEQHGKSIVDSHFSVLQHYLKNASHYSYFRTSTEICKVLEHEQALSNASRALKGLSSISFDLGSS